MDPHRCRLSRPSPHNSPHVSIRSRHWVFVLVALALMAPMACRSGPGQLPAGWSDADFGAPAQPGSANYSNGVWTVQGAGTDICSSGQFHFVWKAVNGDGSIIA